MAAGWRERSRPCIRSASTLIPRTCGTRGNQTCEVNALGNAIKGSHFHLTHSRWIIRMPRATRLEESSDSSALRESLPAASRFSHSASLNWCAGAGSADARPQQEGKKPNAPTSAEDIRKEAREPVKVSLGSPCINPWYTWAFWCQAPM